MPAWWRCVRRTTRRIDVVLASPVAAEDVELRKVELPGQRTLLDRLLQRFKRLGTKRFLAEARTKVWANARILDTARRQRGDDAYAGTLANAGRTNSSARDRSP